jgi:hypothetical protein
VSAVVDLAGLPAGAGYCARQLATWGAQWERSRTRSLPSMTDLLAAQYSFG